MTPLLVVGVVAALLGAILAGFLLTAGRRRINQRAKRISAADRAARAPVGLKLRIGEQRGLDRMVSRLLPRPALLRQRLAASGVGISIGTYGLICLNLGIVVTVVALVRHVAPLIALLAGSLAGLVVPHLAIGFLVGRRRNKFAKLFPDAIGLMVRGLKAGLPVVESMLVVGREIADPVGIEFRRVGDQVRVGQSIEESLWAVARRLNLQEFNFLVITLSIQRETGGNLGETLENLDEMIRKRQQMKLKVKAMSSEAMATAMIIGSLPFVMSGILFLVSRPYIMTLINTQLGNILLGCGIVWMGIGFFVMSQMIRFEI